jgi:tetratricopeptide (TPR) repeat protein
MRGPLACLFLLLAGSVVAQPAPPDYAQLRSDCADSSDAGRQIRGCDAVLANPNEQASYGVALSNRGHARERNGDLAAALADYDRSIAVDPSFPTAHINRGRVLARLGRLDDAVAALDRSIALENSSWARAERGQIHLARRDWDRAQADLDAALRADPQDVEALAARGRVHLGRGNHGSAEVDFAAALALDPSHAGALQGQEEARRESRVARSASRTSPLDQAAPSTSVAPEQAALRRSMFRTYTLLFPSAPAATIEAATTCAAEALARVPGATRQALIDIDRVMFDRLLAYQRWGMAQTSSELAPSGRCQARLSDGEFGPTRGAPAPATAALNPNNVPRCPISVENYAGNELTCYCQPLLGGIAYGHRTYADLSTVCVAAQHAGAMDFLTGGVVRAVFRSGCASYPGVQTATGLSGQRGRTARAFYFPTVGEGACLSSVSPVSERPWRVLVPVVGAREAFDAPYGRALLDELASVLWDSADKACVQERGLRRDAVRQRAAAFMPDKGQVLLDRYFDGLDLQTVETRLLQRAGSDAAELERLVNDPQLAPMRQAFRVAAQNEAAAIVVEHFDRFAIIRRPLARQVSPLATGDARLLSLLEADGPEAIASKLRGGVPEADLDRIELLQAEAVVALFDTRKDLPADRPSELEAFTGLENELAALCIK